MIEIFKPSRYQIPKKKIVQAAEMLLREAQMSDKTLNLIFVGKRKMQDIAFTYKSENVALPVLSFSYKTLEDSDHEKYHDSNLLGEVFLCYPQIVLLASERGRKIDDMIVAMIEHGIANIVNE